MNAIRFLLNPFNILLIMGMITVAAWHLKKTILTKWLVCLLTGFFLLGSTPLVPVLLINSLEDRYDPLDVNSLSGPGNYHILVLGSGHGFDDRLPSTMLLSRTALGRLTEGIRIHRLLPGSKLVFSGYSSSGRTTQAEMLQQAALLLGVDPGATLVQTEPSNTYEEAMIYSGNYGTSHQLILVTNAAHMPRAVMAFEKFGIKPIPAPANYRLKGSWKKKKIGWPSLENLEHFHVGVSSYSAILFYRYWYR